jgi:hypothetical protein
LAFGFGSVFSLVYDPWPNFIVHSISLGHLLLP